MPGVRCAPFLLLGLLQACCSTPPRFDNPTDPASAYRSFRGALARDEVAREYSYLSDGFRERLGVTDRTKWADARLFIGGLKLKAVVCSKVDGDPEYLPDGRALLRIRLPLGVRARVWMRPVPVLRIRLEDDPRPIEILLGGIALEPAPGGGVLLRLPQDDAWVVEEVGGSPVESFEARIEWFIDEIDTGGDD
jgi:hypothetical protein